LKEPKYNTFRFATIVWKKINVSFLNYHFDSSHDRRLQFQAEFKLSNALISYHTEDENHFYARSSIMSLNLALNCIAKKYIANWFKLEFRIRFINLFSRVYYNCLFFIRALKQFVCLICKKSFTEKLLTVISPIISVPKWNLSNCLIIISLKPSLIKKDLCFFSDTQHNSQSCGSSNVWLQKSLLISASNFAFALCMFFLKSFDLLFLFLFPLPLTNYSNGPQCHWHILVSVELFKSCLI
jgi:hypothetical protein